MKRGALIIKALNYIDLLSEVDDYEKIHESIDKGIVFKGTNLWILVFAVIIASVGLNMNSTAVIIGAMLISPLMGPINGIGYSIATYNFMLFKKAVKNFSFAVIASLIASTTYFAISPIATIHSELLARTSPTIYDVIIALFGGMAGIIALSSKQKGNVIPGVAIATALMPPLCTAGYGLATMQFNYFFGAFYLFTINSVFIALSSVVVSQILKFPILSDIEITQKKRINRWISIIIALVLIPSIYFGYILVQKDKFNEKASRYVKSISVVQGNFLLKNEINFKTKTIKLVYGGTSLSEIQKREITKKTDDFSLQNTKIEFLQGLSFDEFTRKNSEVDNLKAEMNRQSLVLKQKDNYLDSLNKINRMGSQILDEIKNLYPQIIKCSYASTNIFNTKTSVPEKAEVIVFTTQRKHLTINEKDRIEMWLKSRLKSSGIKVFYE